MLNRALDEAGHRYQRLRQCSAQGVVLARWGCPIARHDWRDANLGDEVMPRAIKTRLYVSMTDPHWADRVAAATKGERFLEPVSEIAPWELIEHNRGSNVIIEFRPRAGVWNRPFVAIPKNEASGCMFCLGPKNQPPSTAVISGAMDYIKGDLMIFTLQGEASCTSSGFLFCGAKLPSKIGFGNMPRPQYWFANS